MMEIWSKFLGKLLLPVFLVVFLTQCSSKNTEKISKYFDLDGFLDGQIILLESSQPQLTKTMKFDDNSESVVLNGFDSAAWGKELKIFREHDINKPVLVDAYSVSQDSRKAGEKIESYRLLDSSQNGILGMEIEFYSLGHVAAWSSTFKEENLLYSNYREVSFTTGDKGQLTSYEIAGYHKLILKDTVHYKVTAKFTY